MLSPPLPSTLPATGGVEPPHPVSLLFLECGLHGDKAAPSMLWGEISLLIHHRVLFLDF